MKRRVQDSSAVLISDTPPAKLPREVEEKDNREEKTHETGENKDGARSPPADLLQEKKLKSLRASWERVGFRLHILKGHSDIITCVTAVDNLVISGSRDTTVKVWHVPTATEQRNLGGHRGGVTCISAPPPDYCRRLARTLSHSEKERFVLSGSLDCCVRIWALSTGCCVKSIYTFNAVSALCFVPEGEGYIVTGSDGGKVEVWSWESMENCQSVTAHGDSVTSLQCQGPLVFSGSAEGGVSVWEVQYPSHTPLKLLHTWGSSVTGCCAQDGTSLCRLALSPRGDRVFLAYGKASLKILDWRTGTVSRLANHSSIAGVSDCVSQTAGLLIGSCFDLATGESSLNLFSLPQCKYLASLTCPELPRTLCFTAWHTSSGSHRWVTGGRALIVWEQLPANSKQRGDVTARRNTQLEDPLVESNTDTEEDGDDDEDYITQDALQNADAPSTRWFSCVLQ